MSDLYDKRIKICRDCKHFKPVWMHMVEVCSVCGCVMQAKARLPFAECPEGHWGKEKEA